MFHLFSNDFTIFATSFYYYISIFVHILAFLDVPGSIVALFNGLLLTFRCTFTYLDQMLQYITVLARDREFRCRSLLGTSCSRTEDYWEGCRCWPIDEHCLCSICRFACGSL